MNVTADRIGIVGEKVKVNEFHYHPTNAKVIPLQRPAKLDIFVNRDTELKNLLEQLQPGHKAARAEWAKPRLPAKRSGRWPRRMHPRPCSRTGAQNLFEQALAIRREVLGEQHPHTATSLNNLGMLLSHQGDYAAAQSYFEQALTIFRTVLGDNHPHTKIVADNLNSVRDLLEEFQKLLQSWLALLDT